MAMTAWETYVEDRVSEAAADRVRRLDDTAIAKFVQSRLDDDVKRLHNPSSDKTIQLFRDYAGIDLADKWKWNQRDPTTVRARLNQYIKLRGDIVHRSPGATTGPPQPHVITRDDLTKAIRFLKALVEATEKALQSM